MADLAASAAASNGSSGLPAPGRPTEGPTPTGSPSGIRGPRMIMKERMEREARQRAEADKLKMERTRAEQEARLQEEALQNAAQRRPAGAADPVGGDLFAVSDPQRQSAVAQPTATSIPAAQASHHRTNSSRYAANQQIPSQAYAGQSQQQQQQQQQQRQPQRIPQHVRSHSQVQQQPQQQQPIPPTKSQQAGGEAPSQQPAQPTAAVAAGSKPRNSFPHAFERWETLSAHWEGLTSYWIRKLEQNKDDLSRDPVSQQLARQVTDLSAAGANLFHAVVELQRLRASSERKFQRWFFETRGELERAQEVNTMLENALDQERRNRDEAIREALEKDKGSTHAQKQLAEMRKELAISKDEARRAWEELGRREQTERDRTLSLQSGNPTIVGGVQVVPMTQGVGRHQHHPPAAHDAGAHREGYSQGYAADDPPPRSAHSAHRASPSTRPAHAQQQPQQHQHRYQQEGEGGVDYDTPATTNPPSGTYDPPSHPAAATPSGPGGSGQPQPSSSSSGGPGHGHGPDSADWTGTYSDPQDYSGQGYATPAWDDQPRHHHPTRLSDVIEEEDERSRTSASQLSRH